MDLRVKEVQEWLNANYGDNSNYFLIDEDGITGNATCKALVTALQIELGVSTIDGIWGTETSNAFTDLNINSDSTVETIKRQIYILQGGFYCKGIDPLGFTGTFGEGTQAAVMQFETNAGLTSPTGIASAKVMKALLNTDAYTLLSNGDSTIREIQQALNNNYSDYVGLIPCDGIYAKVTCRALISGLQIEQKKEYSNTVVDGIWGEVTMNRCPTLLRYGTVTNRQYVYLLQYALYLNGFDPNGFDGGFGGGVQNAVKNFQSYVGLTSDGIVGKSTWASLMVSYGDTNRTCTAADCRTPLTEETAALLVANGKTAIGRYLTGGLDKALTINELRIIYNAGLKLFPIFQTSGNYADYFTRSKGRTDAYRAYNKYGTLHIPDGGIVYFAVDYDVTMADITNHIIPYFEGINERLNELGNSRFAVGIYAPRYVCSRIRAEGLTVSSFVCDMSSGFTCNIGHTLPADWAFDQIKTLTLSDGNTSLEIDNDFASVRDTSFAVNPDTYEETPNATLNEYNMICNVCNCFGVSPDMIGQAIEIGEEFYIAEISGIEIYGIVNRSATIPDSTYKVSLPVTNGEINSPTFVSNYANVTSEIPLVSEYVSFPEIAYEIDTGAIQIEISTTTSKKDLPALALTITSIATPSLTNKLDHVLSIGVKLVFSEDSSNYNSALVKILGEEQANRAISAYTEMIEKAKEQARNTSETINEAIEFTNILILALGVGIIAVIATGSLGVEVTIAATAATIVDSLFSILQTITLFLQ